MARLLRLLAAASVILLAGFAASPARTAEVMLSGTVSGPAGEPMGGVTLSAKLVGGTITTSIFSDETGGFVFPPLPGGSYRLWAQALGFETATSEVKLDAAARHAITLQPIRELERKVRQLPGDLILAGLPEATEDERRMKRIVRNNCTSCHTPSYTMQHRFDEAGWNAIIGTMKAITVYGVHRPQQINPVLDFHQPELARYLAKARGPSEGGFTLVTRPRPAGEAARAVFREYDLPLNPDQDLPARTPANDGSDWTMGTPSRVGSMPHDAAADLEGNLWFAAVAPSRRMSVGRVDARTGEIKGYKLTARSGLAANAHGLIRDAKGVIWFNAWMPEGGLGRIDPRNEKLDVFLPPDGMSHIEGPVTLDYDGKGGIWAGTPDGVVRFDPATERFTEIKSVTPKTANGGIGSTYGIAGDGAGGAWWTQMAFDTILYGDPASGKATEWTLPPVIEEKNRATAADLKFYETFAPRDIGTPFPWSQGPRRIGLDRDNEILWVANSWGGSLTRVDTRTRAISFVPFPSPATNMPYHATPDRQHNVWAPLWTTDRLAKYDTAAGSWTLFDLPTRGTEVRIVSLRELESGPELVFAYARSSKIAVMTIRSEREVQALKAADRR